jgi:hypothetical protein
MNGPFYVFEACKSAALGDLYRGDRPTLDEATALAISIHNEAGKRTYVLDSLAERVAVYPRSADNQAGGK